MFANVFNFFSKWKSRSNLTSEKCMAKLMREIDKGTTMYETASRTKPSLLDVLK